MYKISEDNFIVINIVSDVIWMDFVKNEQALSLKEAPNILVDS